jgi:hypothetical protein
MSMMTSTLEGVRSSGAHLLYWVVIAAAWMSSHGCCVSRTVGVGTSSGFGAGSGTTTSSASGGGSTGSTGSGTASTGKQTSAGVTSTSTGEGTSGTDTLWVAGVGGLLTDNVPAKGDASFDLTCSLSLDLCSAPGGAMGIDNIGSFWTQPCGQDFLLFQLAGEPPACPNKPWISIAMSVPVAALAFGQNGPWISIPDAGLASLDQSSAFVLRSSNDCTSLSRTCFPAGMVFDSSGYLWVASYESILAFGPERIDALADGGDDAGIDADLVLTTPEAIAWISSSRDAGPYGGYRFKYLAFDSSGDLWATVQSDGDTPAYQIVEFSSLDVAQLDAMPTPTPVLVVQAPPDLLDGGFAGWGAITFDNMGNLWVGSRGDGPNLFRGAPGAWTDGGGSFDIELTVPANPSLSLLFVPGPR